MTKIILVLIVVTLGALVIWGMIAWKDEVKDCLCNEDDDSYCKDLDKRL